MATVYAGNSGYIYKYAGGTWSSIRDATSGNASDNPPTSGDSWGAGVFHTAGRGSNTYRVARSYFYFDTSGITGTLSDATLKIFGKSVSSADIIVIKSDAFGGDGGTALASTDFNNIDFSTAYSAELTTWSTSGYNDLVLNAAALSDIKNNDAFIVCTTEYDHDYSDSAPSSETIRSGMKYDTTSGTSQDPYIDYNVGATGTTF